MQNSKNAKILEFQNFKKMSKKMEFQNSKEIMNNILKFPFVFAFRGHSTHPCRLSDHTRHSCMLSVDTPDTPVGSLCTHQMHPCMLPCGAIGCPRIQARALALSVAPLKSGALERRCLWVPRECQPIKLEHVLTTVMSPRPRDRQKY